METLDNAKKLLQSLRELNREVKKNIIKFDMNINELTVCGLISKNSCQNNDKQNLQIKDISDKMGISRPAVIKIVNDLEHKGIIQRFKTEQDKKAVYVRFTKKANDIHKLAQEQMNTKITNIVKKLGEDDTTMLITLLNKLNEIIKKGDD